MGVNENCSKNKNSHLLGYCNRTGTHNLLVEPVVEVVARRTVVKKSESRKPSKPLEVKNSSTPNERLSEVVAQSPANQGGHGLRCEGVGLELLVVRSPARHSSTTCG